MSPEIQHKIFVSSFSLRRRDEFIRPLLTASLGEKTLIDKEIAMSV